MNIFKFFKLISVIDISFQKNNPIIRKNKQKYNQQKHTWCVFINNFLFTDKNTSTFSYVMIKEHPYTDNSICPDKSTPRTYFVKFFWHHYAINIMKFVIHIDLPNCRTLEMDWPGRKIILNIGNRIKSTWQTKIMRKELKTSFLLI